MDSGFFNTFDAVNQSATINITSIYAAPGSTPWQIWAIFAIASLCLLFACVVLPMRTPEREVNPARIASAALAIVVNAVTAGLSYTIDFDSGTAGSLYLNQSVFVNIHTLYQGVALPIVFTIFGSFATIILIWCLTQREIIEPDLEDFRHNTGAETRAERPSRKPKDGVEEEDED
jgi:hypothetical protein